MAVPPKSKIFLWCLLAFIAGVGMRSYIAMPVVILWILGIVALLVFLWALLKNFYPAAVYAVLAMVLVGGMIRFDTYTRDQPDLSLLFGKPLMLDGVIVREPQFSEQAERLYIETHDRAYGKFILLATTRKYPAYHFGDAVAVEGILRQPENFGEFDYVSYLSREGVSALMVFPQIKKTGEGTGLLVRRMLARIKYEFEKNIDGALPEPHAAFLKGLILGERASLPPDLVADFRASGTSHIVALSGYNITVVGRSLMNALLFFTVPFAVSFWIAVVSVILFVIMTGASASVVRAAIMGILVLIANKEGRTYHLTNALAFAGAVMVFQNPLVLRFDTGFQLSFCATAGLFYFSPHVKRFLEKIKIRLYARTAGEHNLLKPREPGKLQQIFIETLSAQLAVLPLLIYVFGRVSMVSPLTNILVLAAVPYAMGMGALTGALGFIFEPFAQAIGWIAWFLLEYMLLIIKFFARIPLASVAVGPWAIVPLAGIYIFVLRATIWNDLLLIYKYVIIETEVSRNARRD